MSSSTLKWSGRWSKIHSPDSTDASTHTGSIKSGQAVRKSFTMPDGVLRDEVASCGVRAEMTAEDTAWMFNFTNFDRMAHGINTVSEAWRSEHDVHGIWSLATHCGTIFRSRETERMLQALAVVSIVVEPFLLAIEPACETSTAMAFMTVVKQANCAASFFYSTMSLGEMCALGKNPLKLLFGCQPCRRGRITHPSGQTMESVRCKFDWLLFDQLALIGLLADFMHLFERVHNVPTWIQWLSVVNFIKGWRLFIGLRSAARSFRHEVVRLCMSVFLVAHLSACACALVAILCSSYGRATWGDAELLQETRYCPDFYWTMFYFSAYTITTVGHGDVIPQGWWDRSFNAVLMILSIMYMWKACSRLIFLIASRNYWKAQRLRRVTQTLAVLESVNAPARLRERILWYQHYIWELRTERRSEKCFKDLSEISTFELKGLVYQKLVHTAACFQQMPLAFLWRIVRTLEDLIHLPSDFIVRRGDEGSDMFFLREGAAGVFVLVREPTWKDEEVKVLTQGDYFGEVGMLTAQKRTAWIMARTFCVSSRLSKSTMDDVVAASPQCLVLLAKSMQKACGLMATITWKEVALLLLKMLRDVQGIFDYIQNSDEEVNEEPGHVTFTRYEKLMRSILVSRLNIRLLWIDIDTDQEGSVTFDNFIHIALSDLSEADMDSIVGKAFPSGFHPEESSAKVRATSSGVEESLIRLQRHSVSSTPQRRVSISSASSQRTTSQWRSRGSSLSSASSSAAKIVPVEGVSRRSGMELQHTISVDSQTPLHHKIMRRRHSDGAHSLQMSSKRLQHSSSAVTMRRFSSSSQTSNQSSRMQQRLSANCRTSLRHSDMSLQHSSSVDSQTPLTCSTSNCVSAGSQGPNRGGMRAVSWSFMAFSESLKHSRILSGSSSPSRTGSRSASASLTRPGRDSERTESCRANSIFLKKMDAVANNFLLQFEGKVAHIEARLDELELTGPLLTNQFIE